MPGICHDLLGRVSAWTTPIPRPSLSLGDKALKLAATLED